MSYADEFFNEIARAYDEQEADLAAVEPTRETMSAEQVAKQRAWAMEGVQLYGTDSHIAAVEICDSHELLRAQLAEASRDLKLIRENCRVIYYPPQNPVSTYPVEHTMAAKKDAWDIILGELRARALSPGDAAE
jgi:hypothetical protein